MRDHAGMALVYACLFLLASESKNYNLICYFALPFSIIEMICFFVNKFVGKTIMEKQ